MTYVQAYEQAFMSCYRQTKLQIRNRWDRVAGTMTHWVYINGDRGDRPLTEADMRDATRALMRGRVGV